MGSTGLQGAQGGAERERGDYHRHLEFFLHVAEVAVIPDVAGAGLLEMWRGG